MAKMSRNQRENVKQAYAGYRPILTTASGRQYLVDNGWARRWNGVVVPTIAGLIAAGIDMDALHREAFVEDLSRRLDGTRALVETFGGTIRNPADALPVTE